MEYIYEKPKFYYSMLLENQQFSLIEQKMEAKLQMNTKTTYIFDSNSKMCLVTKKRKTLKSWRRKNERKTVRCDDFCTSPQIIIWIFIDMTYTTIIFINLLVCYAFQMDLYTKHIYIFCCTTFLHAALIQALNININIHTVLTHILIYCYPLSYSHEIQDYTLNINFTPPIHLYD